MTLDVESLFRLDGRTALITGGTRGIGRAMADAFAAAGARIVVASRKAEVCAETEAEMIARGHEVLAVPSHMGSIEDIRSLVGAANDRFGGIDILVNNAANALAEPVGGFTEAGFTKSFDVNVRGPIFLVQEALPLLKQSEHASVINLVSAGAFMFSGGLALYAAGKAAMVSFTRSMAAELAPLGVRVNALAPGTIDTHMLRQTGPDAAELMGRACLMRRVATPEEMIGPALFLASDASSYVTGSVLHADGGLVAG